MERERWLDWATGKVLAGLQDFGRFHVRDSELSERVARAAQERGMKVKRTPLLGAWRLEVVNGNANGAEGTG